MTGSGTALNETSSTPTPIKLKETDAFLNI